MLAKCQTLNKIAKELLARACWALPCPLPINKNKIVFTSFNGTSYSDNPRALAEEIIKRKINYKLKFNVINRSNKRMPKIIDTTLINRPASIFHQRTAGVWIDNCRKPSYVNKRNGQIYIQTWHGGIALKKIEKDAESALSGKYIKSAKNDSKMCDLMISNSSISTKIFKNSFWYSGEVLECGIPRNDIFFQKDNTVTIANKARESFNIPNDKKILLYAPTFRRHMSMDAYDLDYKKILSALKSKFDDCDWVVLIKLHPNIASKSTQLKIFEDKSVYDASSYPELQELLLLADILITDYSSSMFDFMLTKKPCFLYVNDIDDYKNDRNFYIDIDILPFSSAKTNDKLANNIANFDKKDYAKKIDDATKEYGIVDSGNAAKSVVDWIQQRQEDTK